MSASFVLLAVISILGAFDIFFFHRPARLARRVESRGEAVLHIVRGVLYTLQLGLLPHVSVGGLWVAALAALYLLDVVVALADVASEPGSRREIGGLPAGEYVMHIVLSVLVGAYLRGVVSAAGSWMHEPTALVWQHADLPFALHIVLAVLALGCAAVTLAELAELVDAILPAPRPLHVTVQVAASLARLWEVTQDHHRHPDWDHRFSRIILDGPANADAAMITTGTTMRYERDLLGLTIRGLGRYKLHALHKQSSFEFWSNDPRSLIQRGVGLWRYRQVDGHTAELRTSYTYAVRWGLCGRWIDRLIFRPLLQRETERSFARLAGWFPAASPVYGRHGRKAALPGAW